MSVIAKPSTSRTAASPSVQATTWVPGLAACAMVGASFTGATFTATVTVSVSPAASRIV